MKLNSNLFEDYDSSNQDSDFSSITENNESESSS